MTTTPTTPVGPTDDGWLRLPVLQIEDLAWLIGILEDWLLHASDDAYDDLAHFAGRGPFTRPADQHGRLIAHQLGDHHVTLLGALRAAGIDC